MVMGRAVASETLHATGRQPSVPRMRIETQEGVRGQGLGLALAMASVHCRRALERILDEARLAYALGDLGEAGARDVGASALRALGDQ